MSAQDQDSEREEDPSPSSPEEVAPSSPEDPEARSSPDVDEDLTTVDFEKLGKEAVEEIKKDGSIVSRAVAKSEIVVSRPNGQFRLSDNNHLLSPIKGKPSLSDLVVYLISIDRMLMHKINPGAKGPSRKYWIKEQAKRLKKLVLRNAKNTLEADKAEEDKAEESSEDPRPKSMKKKKRKR